MNPTTNNNVTTKTVMTEEKKEVRHMKKSWKERIVSVLDGTHIPAAIIAAVLTIGKNNLVEIAYHGKEDELKKLPGIGDKRAAVIAANLKKALMNGRLSTKAERREKAPAYNCFTFEDIELWREEIKLIEKIADYRANHMNIREMKVNAKKVHRLTVRVKNGRKISLKPNIVADELVCRKVKKLKKELDTKLENKKFSVRAGAGRSIRLNKSAPSDVIGIDYDSKKRTEKIMVVEHSIQKLFNFDPKLFSNDKRIGQLLKDEYQQKLEFKILSKGIYVIGKVDVKLYGGIASSASHQKRERLMMALASEIKKHSDFFWFGKDYTNFALSTTMLGAEFWKIRGNLIRPWMKPLKTKKGEIIRMKDVLFVKDVKRLYIIKNGRRIGKLNGALVRNGKEEELVTLGDGGVLFIYPMETQGQCSGAGLKGMGVDATSCIKFLCKKHKMTIEEFYDLEVEGIDGKMHRIGDFKAIAGEGCWKFDKAFDNFNSYSNWLDKMAEKYPCIDYVYLLRQSEEIEDEEKVRRLTKTLIQQWMIMGPDEIRKITSKVRHDLKKAKSFKGAVNKLAALWKKDEERTNVERLFNMCPWLVMNKNIQDYLEGRWNNKVIEAASCKFRTNGQYPYIMQDPVALLEVWVLGLDPNRDDLGVLRGEEVSVADVPDGKELLCVRFPANFLTAKVMANRACIEAFESMNGVMVLSIYSDILIRQDGDVDGDEMCVIYDRLAIELTKRMIEKFNPPVVLFEHGSKAERHSYATPEEFMREASNALWRAKRYDSVGLYANLAMKLAYLAAVAYARGDMKACEKFLTWMSVASTGAILAIDQVKGNAVDESLIKWLEDIQKEVRKEFKKLAAEMGFTGAEVSKRQNPFVHFYNEAAKRRPIDMDKCLPANEDNFVDMIASMILHDVGTWAEFDAQGVVWNDTAAPEALLDHSVHQMRVKYGVLNDEMKELLADNWFKFTAKAGEIDTTAATRIKIRKGDSIGFKEFMLLLWRNECSMSYSMEGATLWEKKEEYYDVCRQLIKMFLKSGDWTNKFTAGYPIGYKFNEKERWAVASNAAIQDALELGCNNNLDTGKGSYAIFVLNIFAKEAIANVQKNGVNNARFFACMFDIADLMLDNDLEEAKEFLELFEDAPEKVYEETKEDNVSYDYEEAPFDPNMLPPEEYENDLANLPDDIAC